MRSGRGGRRKEGDWDPIWGARRLRLFLSIRVGDTIVYSTNVLLAAL